MATEITARLSAGLIAPDTAVISTKGELRLTAGALVAASAAPVLAPPPIILVPPPPLVAALPPASVFQTPPSPLRNVDRCYLLCGDADEAEQAYAAIGANATACPCAPSRSPSLISTAMPRRGSPVRPCLRSAASSPRRP